MQTLLPSRAAAFGIHNPQGGGPLLLICEHASNYVPDEYAGLGLSASDLQRHIAWDIGALGLAKQLADLLDAPLILATHSRLLMDLNRDPSASDSIVVHSEDTAIPGNVDLTPSERCRRRDDFYQPFHTAAAWLIDERLARGQATAVVSIHSFTPRYLDCLRPWHAGVLSRSDRRLADPLINALRRDLALTVGDNQPYAPEQGVYHTLELHAQRRGLLNVLIEVRNDLIGDTRGQAQWAKRLAVDLQEALQQCSPKP